MPCQTLSTEGLGTAQQQHPGIRDTNAQSWHYGMVAPLEPQDWEDLQEYLQDTKKVNIHYHHISNAYLTSHWNPGNCFIQNSGLDQALMTPALQEFTATVSKTDINTGNNRSGEKHTVMEACTPRDHRYPIYAV